MLWTHFQMTEDSNTSAPERRQKGTPSRSSNESARETMIARNLEEEDEHTDF